MIAYVGLLMMAAGLWIINGAATPDPDALIGFIGIIPVVFGLGLSIWSSVNPFKNPLKPLGAAALYLVMMQIIPNIDFGSMPELIQGIIRESIVWLCVLVAFLLSVQTVLSVIRGTVRTFRR